jgi:hypothetical protein
LVSNGASDASLDVKNPQLTGVGEIRLESMYLAPPAFWQASEDYGKADEDVKRIQFSLHVSL